MYTFTFTGTWLDCHHANKFDHNIFNILILHTSLFPVNLKEYNLFENDYADIFTDRNMYYISFYLRYMVLIDRIVHINNELIVKSFSMDFWKYSVETSVTIPPVIFTLISHANISKYNTLYINDDEERKGMGNSSAVNHGSFLVGTRKLGYEHIWGEVYDELGLLGGTYGGHGDAIKDCVDREMSELRNNSKGMSIWVDDVSFYNHHEAHTHSNISDSISELSFVDESEKSFLDITPEAIVNTETFDLPEYKGNESSDSPKSLRIKNVDRIIFAHLNINSIRNKFVSLTNLINGNIDILLVAETKIDDSFPTAQFCIPGYTLPYRCDRNIHGGGLLLYTRVDIPSKLVKFNASHNYSDCECMLVEINLHNKKWLIIGSYNPSKHLIGKHLDALSNIMNQASFKYDNFIIMGDFNSDPKEKELQEFFQLYCLKNLITEPTCYKSCKNPTCIDLIITNRPTYFQHSTTFETGISDFHKIVMTVMKTQFRKYPAKIVTYRDYRNYSKSNFHNELKEAMINENLYEVSNDTFVHKTMEIIDRHVPLKQKYIRANQGPFMTKDLQKAIMVRSKLKNKFNLLKTQSAYTNYKKQRNLCTYLLRKAKRNYYSNLNPCKITDNKKFWKIVKPLFSDKAITKENITLVEKEDILQDEKIVAETFNSFFSNVVKNLKIEINNDQINDDLQETDPILRAIEKYSKHHSIIKINEVTENGKRDTFSFKHETYENVYNAINTLNSSKASPKNSIPSKILKDSCDIFSQKFLIDFNTSISSGIFPTNLKFADVSPTHKSGNRTDKINYRPVSILSAPSKVFERLLFQQMHYFIEANLSNNQCGFRKGFSAQHCLIVMIEKWRKAIDNKGSTGVLLTDLSKAFDCLIHDLLIAKLNAYGFNYASLHLIHSYLTNRCQRVRVNANYSSWSEIIYGVPQGSILGPVLFNIYLSDLFLFITNTDIANYADDNSPYACKGDIESVITKLENDSRTLIEWVSNNALKANPDKFHLLLNSDDKNISINVENCQIFNSQNEKLLGIVIDNDLKFDEHVTRLCNKGSQKLHALARVSPYMNTNQRRRIMKAFISSQFGYCPLVWMFHSRTLNNRINRLHERALRIVYNDNLSSFEQLLHKDSSVTIHERNIQALAIEIYKIINGLAPDIMNIVLPLKDSNKYCSRFPFKTQNIRTVRYGSETIHFLGPKIWSAIPQSYKNVTTLEEFKNKIKQWKPICPCRLCKTYVASVGFIDGNDK